MCLRRPSLGVASKLALFEKPKIQPVSPLSPSRKTAAQTTSNSPRASTSSENSAAQTHRFLGTSLSSYTSTHSPSVKVPAVHSQGRRKGSRIIPAAHYHHQQQHQEDNIREKAEREGERRDTPRRNAVPGDCGGDTSKPIVVSYSELRIKPTPSHLIPTKLEVSILSLSLSLSLLVFSSSLILDEPPFCLLIQMCVCVCVCVCVWVSCLQPPPIIDLSLG